MSKHLRVEANTSIHKFISLNVRYENSAQYYVVARIFRYFLELGIHGNVPNEMFLIKPGPY